MLDILIKITSVPRFPWATAQLGLNRIYQKQTQFNHLLIIYIHIIICNIYIYINHHKSVLLLVKPPFSPCLMVWNELFMVKFPLCSFDLRIVSSHPRPPAGIAALLPRDRNGWLRGGCIWDWTRVKDGPTKYDVVCTHIYVQDRRFWYQLIYIYIL